MPHQLLFVMTPALDPFQGLKIRFSLNRLGKSGGQIVVNFTAYAEGVC